MGLAGKQYGMLNGQKWCQQCISKRSAAKAYTATMTKLRSQDTHTLHKTNLGKERLCHHCKKKIAGRGVQIELESGKYEYHRYCVFCSDCKKKINTFEVKIFKDKKLCGKCVTKYLDFNHGKKFPK